MAGSPIKHERNRVWREAIIRALEKRAGGDADVISALEPIAEKLVAQALAGEISHVKELGDRLDGKAAQQVLVSGDGTGNPVVVEIVRFADKAP